MSGPQGLRLVPQYHERVWGGHRLQPGPTAIGEAWVVYEGNAVADGPEAGRTLAELARAYGPALLGRRAFAATGDRFPLLIKLLETTDWLSVQVHPDDRCAAQLEGPGHFGKTEAWHILEVEPGAQIICGFNDDVGTQEILDSLETGAVVEHARFHTVDVGDTFLIPAGTLHALGPGLLLYEVQQTSDLTYRVYDWGRPASAGRPLHLAQSRAALKPTGTVERTPPPSLGRDDRALLTTCDYFTLEVVQGAAPMSLDTAGESFHALTGVAGSGRVAGEGWSQSLAAGETSIVPASVGPYRIEPEGELRLLKASVG